MAATCGVLLHIPSSVAANNSDLFFDFSSKMRVGSTATSTVDGDGKSRRTIDGEAAEATVADTTPAFEVKRTSTKRRQML